MNDSFSRVSFFLFSKTDLWNDGFAVKFIVSVIFEKYIATRRRLWDLNIIQSAFLHELHVYTEKKKPYRFEFLKSDSTQMIYEA